MASGEAGTTFWYNRATGARQWKKPERLAWKQERAEPGRHGYFWNEFTGETSWHKPEPLAWSRKQEL